MVPVDRERLVKKIERVGVSALRRRFSPEFVNRIDAVLTYQPLGRESLARILDQQIAEFRQLVHDRFPGRAFRLELTEESMRFLLEQGTSHEYGARELRRTVHRHVIQPVSSKLARGELTPDSTVRLGYDSDNRCLTVLSGRALGFTPAGTRGAKRAGAASRLRLTA
jgi:ATP-dependent Clp protease ATP-binding subunit ClpA